MGIDKVLKGNDDELTTNAVVKELIGRNWPNKVDNLPASRLAPKYIILFKNLLYNLDSPKYR